MAGHSGRATQKMVGMALDLLLTVALAVTRSLAPPPAAGARPLDAVWRGELRGHPSVLVLRERGDGRLLGDLPSDPASWVSGGRRDGRRIRIDLAGGEGTHAWTGTFSGNLGGSSIAGTVIYSDLGAQAMRFRRSSIPSLIEHWLVFDAVEERGYRAPRILNASRAFVLGGFGQAEGCGFLGCAGAIGSWNIAGLDHAIAVAAEGDCPTPASLTGVWDASTLLVQGSWSRSTMACRPGATGAFMGGKEGLASLGDLGDAISLLRDFADAVEAESPLAADAFAATYLNDGTARADWQTVLGDLYAAFDDLDAAVTEVRQVVTANDDDVNPRVKLSPRLEWSLTVTGIPYGGGGRTTALARKAALVGNQDLFWIGREGGAMKFVGNGASEPFLLELPIAAGDQAYAAFGIWPYGVHGGGHPEGHPGVDLEYRAGAQVLASAAGTIDRIEANGEFPGQLDLRVQHRPSYATRYGHVGALAAGISAGASVTTGQPLGAAGDTGNGVSHHYITHWAVDRGIDQVCPLEFLSPAAAGLFNTIWANAAYTEELTEPFPCNPVAVSFPLTRTWTRTSGSLAPRLDFIRLDAHTQDYRYVLRNAAGTQVDAGTVSSLQTNRGPTGGLIDLHSDGGAVRLGRYRIIGAQMLITWATTRPGDLAGATVYATVTAP